MLRTTPVLIAIATLLLTIVLIPYPKVALSQQSISPPVMAIEKDQKKEDFWPSTALGWLSLVGVPAAAVWALVTFVRNNRVKAAEIFMNLESRYSELLPTLLEIEHLSIYQEKYAQPLKIALRRIEQPTFRKDEDSYKDVIRQVDDVLRHFFVCENVRRLKVDAGAIDSLCNWYLRILVTEVDASGKLLRPDMRDYVRYEWPSVYFWAEVSSQPLPMRVFTRLKQLLERQKNWWSGIQRTPQSPAAFK